MDERHVAPPGPRPTSDLAEQNAMAEEAVDDARWAPADDGRGKGISRRRPRTEGDVTAMPVVQIALGLLAIFLFLLVLWAIWPLISGV